MVAGQAVALGDYSVRLAFAEEQCRIFAEMSDKAAAALNSRQANVEKAAEYLEYVHSYYPSGTKHVVGSSLAAIVENCRYTSEQRIIEALRATTGFHFSSGTTEWIEHLTH